MAKSKGASKIIVVLVLLALLGGGYYLYQKNRALAPTVPESEIKDINNPQGQPQTQVPNPEVPKPASATNTKNNTTSPDYVPTHYSTGEGDVPAPDIQVWQIDYDGTEFSPKTLKIKVGDYVIFKTTSANGFWPASGPHPLHTGYPGFDAGKVIIASSKYQFQFNKVGAWGFHDHLNPSATGVINVVQ